MKQPNFQKTKSARVMQVIETVSLAGDGTEAHPVYELHQYWSLDGKFLAESSLNENQQNLDAFSTKQLLKELTKRDDVKVSEHRMTKDHISLSLQLAVVDVLFFLIRRKLYSTEWTLPLLVLIHGEDFLIQFFPVMPSNVPIFEKQLQNLDELLSFARVNIDD